MNRPNFYDLLQLDPSVKDAGTIDAAISAKQKEWSRDRNHPKKGRQAQQNLGLLNEIRKVFADPVLRGREADAFRHLRLEARQAVERELTDQIDIYSANGYMTEEQVANLLTRFQGQFSDDEIRKRIKVPIGQEQRRQKPVLEQSLIAEIGDRLRIVRKTDLYDFLGSRSPETADLLQRAKKVYADAQSDNNKTAEVTARGELAGHCLRVFKSDAEREKYDNSLVVQSLRLLDPLIEAAASDGKISPEEMEALLRKAGEKGISVGDAQDYVRSVATQKGWAVPRPKGIVRVLAPPNIGRRSIGTITSAELKMANEGVADVECQLTSDASWLRVDQPFARLLPGHATVVPLTVDLRQQAEGQLSGFIHVRWEDGECTTTVSVLVARPVPGKLEVPLEAHELGNVFAGQRRQLDVPIRNAGDTPISVSLAIPTESISLEAKEIDFDLFPREQKTLGLTVTPAQHTERGREIVETVYLRHGQEQLPIRVRFRVAEEPTVIDRYCVAASFVAPAIIVPAFLSWCFSSDRTLAVYVFFCFVAWVVTPLAMSAYHRFWFGRHTDLLKLGKTVGYLSVLWLLAPSAVRLIRVVLGFFVGLVADPAVAGVTVAAVSAAVIGCAWIVCFYLSEQLPRHEVQRLGIGVMGSFVLSGLWDWKGLGGFLVFNNVILFTLLAIVMAIGCAHAADTRETGLDHKQVRVFRVFWTVCLPVLLYVLFLGVGLRIASPQAPVIKSVEYWVSVAKYQLLRVH